MKKKSLLFIVLLIFIKINAQNQHGNHSILALPLHGSKMQNLESLSIGESILYPCGHLKALTKNGINIGWIIKS